MVNEALQFGTQFPAWLLLAGGAALGWLRNFWQLLYNHTIGVLARRASISITIEEFDHGEAYLWLQFWVEQRLSERKISALQLRRAAKPQYYMEDEDAASRLAYELVPTYGSYPFIWRSRYLVIFSSSKENGPSPGDFAVMVRRSISLVIWGTRDRAKLLELIGEARAVWEKLHPASLRYFYHRYSYWKSRNLAERPRSTVYLPAKQLDAILDDARGFLAQQKAYHSLGIPWRHGILLVGPPGTGKTTVVQCMATELNLPLYYLSLASLRSREDLAELLDSVSPGSILLIEDIDRIDAAVERINAAPEQQGATAAAPQPTTAVEINTTATPKITASDLLNFVDGIIASQGRLLVMTSNHPERLDPALVRSRRVDKRWAFDYAQRPELEAFYNAAQAQGLARMPMEDYFLLLPEPATIADAQALLLTESYPNGQGKYG